MERQATPSKDWVAAGAASRLMLACMIPSRASGPGRRRSWPGAGVAARGVWFYGGLTHTETWHSALLGWLVRSEGQLFIGIVPTGKALAAINSLDDLPLERRGIDLNELSVSGDFSAVRVRPNERELFEVTVSDMRFDIFVDGIRHDRSTWKEVHLLCEVKVNAAIDKRQNRNYIEYTKRMADGGTWSSLCTLLQLRRWVAPLGNCLATIPGWPWTINR